MLSCRDKTVSAQARDLILAKLLHYRSLHSHLQHLATRASPSDTGQFADDSHQVRPSCALPSAVPVTHMHPQLVGGCQGSPTRLMARQQCAEACTLQQGLLSLEQAW